MKAGFGRRKKTLWIMCTDDGLPNQKKKKKRNVSIKQHCYTLVRVGGPPSGLRKKKELEIKNKKRRRKEDVTTKRKNRPLKKERKKPFFWIG